MTIKEALIQFMKENGYSALCNGDLPCGCGIDDLMPCGHENCDIEECELGYTISCTHAKCKNKSCEGKGDLGNSECYTTTKPKKARPAPPLHNQQAVKADSASDPLGVKKLLNGLAA